MTIRHLCKKHSSWLDLVYLRFIEKKNCAQIYQISYLSKSTTIISTHMGKQHSM